MNRRRMYSTVRVSRLIMHVRTGPVEKKRTEKKEKRGEFLRVLILYRHLGHERKKEGGRGEEDNARPDSIDPGLVCSKKRVSPLFNNRAILSSSVPSLPSLSLRLFSPYRRSLEGCMDLLENLPPCFTAQWFLIWLKMLDLSRTHEKRRVFFTPTYPPQYAGPTLSTTT